MPSSRARYVTVCQQLLTLGVVLAVVTPAANIVSLDVVQRAPVTTAPTALAAYAATTTLKSEVPSGVVDPIVTEVPLTAPVGGVRGRTLAGAPQARIVAGKGGGAQLTSLPQAVSGYGAVGVTWGKGPELSKKQIQVHVRTETDDAWTEWMPVAYDAEHGPDPRSEEAKHSRPGTDALLVGDVDEVQVKVTTPQGAAPADLKLAVIAPGEPTATKVEAPAIDTRESEAPTSARTAPVPTTDPPVEDPVADPAAPGAIEMQAATFTPKPVIYSRAQWGADERMRDKSSLHYFEVHAGFVHHTVNANNYTKAQVPGLLRSIYAYHTRSRGWSDIGYNYLVDRFGRIWEGRYGGVDRPVVGAHTLGYNDYSFAMSAIGNYDIAKPSDAMVQAYGALFAWKLSLHGVSASSRSQQVGRKSFQAINGHRDADSTACPGKYLYAKIPQIRTLAAAAQRGWAGRELESNLTFTPHPDLIIRRTSDQQAFVLPLRGTGGKAPYRIARPIATGVSLVGVNKVLNAGDWNRDGHGDMIYRRTNGYLYLRLGTGRGTFSGPRLLSTAFKKVQLLAAVGDATGDGWPDLMGQPQGSSMRIYPGTGVKPLSAGYVAAGKVTATRQIAVGRMDVDGAPDVLFRGSGKVTLSRGNGPGGLTSTRAMSVNLTPYDWIVGISDVGLTGHSDLVVRQTSTKALYLIEMTASGFGAPKLLGQGLGGYDLAG
ncbi:N-acetylmuramoyl-L-alanine amidase [Nocardioides sp. 503]|uniref:N-acetylmuramoyl-L-alanine amidase n=1 Tax=Nocardioides sp. 503 TaxID=2508326 RepID=UPI00106F894E|nr:N-acetylmuramoyl-L-alanine amidase [Nocardioides sp. 503]